MEYNKPRLIEFGAARLEDLENRLSIVPIKHQSAISRLSGSRADIINNIRLNGAMAAGFASLFDSEIDSLVREQGEEVQEYFQSIDPRLLDLSERGERFLDYGVSALVLAFLSYDTNRPLLPYLRAHTSEFIRYWAEKGFSLPSDPSQPMGGDDSNTLPELDSELIAAPKSERP